MDKFGILVVCVLNITCDGVTHVYAFPWSPLPQSRLYASEGESLFYLNICARDSLHSYASEEYITRLNEMIATGDFVVGFFIGHSALYFPLAMQIKRKRKRCPMELCLGFYPSDSSSQAATREEQYTNLTTFLIQPGNPHSRTISSNALACQSKTLSNPNQVIEGGFVSGSVGSCAIFGMILIQQKSW
jgi:hypothetical protein